MATQNRTQIHAAARLADARDWLAQAQVELAQGEGAQEDVDAALHETEEAAAAVEAADGARVQAQTCPAFSRQQAFLSQWR